MPFPFSLFSSSSISSLYRFPPNFHLPPLPQTQMSNFRKLLHRDKVQVRQLEEGLRGSWHSGVVVGVSSSCRDVKYDDLLCESGNYKLVESIPVTGAIEGLYQRPSIKSNYRGRIRPVPPHREPCSLNSGLKFGACVDVLYKEAWWEGVIFDCDEAAKERCVYFPDENDVRVYKLSDICLTYVWDEFYGTWRERGIWLLVNLAREHKKDGNLFQLIRRAWLHLKVHYGFQKMISEWTCGAYCVWKEYFREVIREIKAKPRAEALIFPTTYRHVAEKRSHKSKGGKYLNVSVLTRSMQRRIDKEVSLAVRTRRMCMSNPENSPISAATKGSCMITESPKPDSREEYDQGKSVCCVRISDSVIEKGGFHHGKTVQNRNLNSRSPCCYENNSKMPVKTCFRRKRHIGDNILTPKKPKPSKISSSQLQRQTRDGTRTMRHVDNHISLRVLGYEPVGRRKGLMQTPLKAGFTMRYLVQRQRGRRLVSIRIIRKKRSPLKINKRFSRKCEEDKDNPNPSFLDASGPSKSSRKEEEVSGSHYTSTVADSCQDLGSEDVLNNPDKHRARSSRYCDSVCFICQYGDYLLHCDHCMSSYHLPCVDLEEATIGGVLCPSCRCGLCGWKGSASNDQLFSDVCYQCSRQYHLSCLDQAWISVSEDTGFCSKSCFEICASLHQLLRISNSTSVEGLMWIITRSRRNDCNVYNERPHPLIQVSQVLNVFHECFQPIAEPHTGRDLVTDIVYNSGSKLRRLDFHGFYVMALVDGDELVCAATIRIHGQKVAEMPLIATPFNYRRQGMCRLLLQELEKMLVELGVERLVLPGIATLSDTWVSSFGFKEMPASVRRELLGYPFVVFQGTTMFQKILGSSFEVPANSTAPGSTKANESATSSSNNCDISQIDTTKRVLRPITRTYAKRYGWNSEVTNLKLGSDCGGSLQKSMKPDRAQLKCSQENCCKSKPNRFNQCNKRKKQEAFKEKTVIDDSDKNQPIYKCAYKRRRIQASRDSSSSSDCL